MVPIEVIIGMGIGGVLGAVVAVAIGAYFVTKYIQSEKGKKQ